MIVRQMESPSPTITELLGGEISVVSAPGEGTCFKIVHPVRRTETAAETAGAYR